MNPLDELRETICGFASLSDGWDGEQAAAPTQTAIGSALCFLRIREDLGDQCSATLGADGSVLLEGDDGEWTIEFSPSGSMIMSGAVPPAPAGSQPPSPKDHPHA